jgi:hypothetical protein
MEVGGQIQVPAALSRGKNLRYPLDRRLSMPKSLPGRGGEENNSQALPEIEPLSSSL